MMKCIYKMTLCNVTLSSVVLSSVYRAPYMRQPLRKSLPFMLNFLVFYDRLKVKILVIVSMKLRRFKRKYLSGFFMVNL